MATNFRLAYKFGNDYADLFLRTSIGSVIDSENSLEFVQIPITIPATSDVIQTIPFAGHGDLSNFWVEIRLKSSGGTSVPDYSTITQFEVKANQLVVTRLNEKPVNPIDVELLFYKQGVK